MFQMNMDHFTPAYLNTFVMLPIFPMSVLLKFLGLFLLVAAVRVKLPKSLGGLSIFSRFIYATFLKPHAAKDGVTGQQSALESFYRTQVNFLYR